MLSHGVTTAEVKSGYGLDTETELRLLDARGTAGRRGAGRGRAHVPGRSRGRAGVPRPAGRGRGRTSTASSTTSCRAVAEQGIATSATSSASAACSTPTSRAALLVRAQELGLAARLHADEIHDSGGAQLAAMVGALSADHLGAISDDGIDALGKAADSDQPVVATLLPLTSFYLDEPAYAPARRLIERGVPVAIGTDFNPGTSPAPNAQLALAFAVHRLGLSAAEALAAATINAAAALGMADSHGSLEVGKHADLVDLGAGLARAAALLAGRGPRASRRQARPRRRTRPDWPSRATA